MNQFFTPTALRALAEKCIHCGMCLPACPTYDIFRTEMEGPRGRIALIYAAVRGEIAPNSAFVTHLDLCLGCRACESACPSGVPYGALIEEARHLLLQARPPGRVTRFLRRWVFAHILAQPVRLRRWATLLSPLRRWRGLKRLAGARWVPYRLRVMLSLLPPWVEGNLEPGGIYPAVGERQGRVAFFHGCVQDALLSHVNRATVRVLQRNGFDVIVPQGQTCCGAAALHVGEADVARALARHTIDLFLAVDCDAIINNAGGCGAALKEYPRLLRDDPAYASKAERFASLVQDISEFLLPRLRVKPQRSVPARVVYVDSCHLRHGQKIIAAPRRLLNAIPGVELVELKQPDRCCGSAGVYNILHPDVADQVLDAKMADVMQTGANIIITANTGCYFQMLRGVRRWDLNLRVAHVVELLDEAYGGAEVNRLRTSSST